MKLAAAKSSGITNMPVSLFIHFICSQLRGSGLCRSICAYIYSCQTCLRAVRLAGHREHLVHGSLAVLTDGAGDQGGRESPQHREHQHVQDCPVRHRLVHRTKQAFDQTASTFLTSISVNVSGVKNGPQTTYLVLF